MRGVATDCVVNFDNIHTIPRDVFRHRITALSPKRLARACQTLRRHRLLNPSALGLGVGGAGSCYA